MSRLFPDSQEHWYRNGDVELFARIAGSGPPLLLIHGFPQTHAMWHRVVPRLRERFTCVMPDLRGYGLSSCPPNDAQNEAYSKRAMARDCLSLMTSLGHRRFAVVGHDRGARVAYRLALDHGQALNSLTVLDIVTTYDQWNAFNFSEALKTYHWAFLAQPYPLPEMLIEHNPVGYMDYTLASWTKTKNLTAFAEEALAEYRLHYATPEHINGTCNDYRAGATCDYEADRASRAGGAKITCPVLALWGDSGIPARHAAEAGHLGLIPHWQEWCVRVEGHGIDSGHFIPEENPEALLSSLLPFLDAHAH